MEVEEELIEEKVEKKEGEIAGGKERIGEEGGGRG